MCPADAPLALQSVRHGRCPLLTIDEILRLPVLEPGRPELLHGEQALDRQVRWVHTSEIAGIGPLLKGGEVLLTTGLGLAGATEADHDRYVRELADRDVAALFLELGRTFATVPRALLTACRRYDLPFVALHGVVPFIEITETVHALLISRRLGDLARADAITESLNDVLLRGGGLVALLDRTAQLAGAPARVTGPAGRVVATSDPVAFGDEVPLRPRPRATITVFGRPWGHVELDLPPGTSTGLLLERAAVAIGIELLRTGETANPKLLARHAFLTDLATGRIIESAEIRARAELVDLHLAPHRPVHAVALQLDRAAGGRASNVAAESVAQRTLPSASLAIVEDDGLGLVGVESDDPRGELEHFAEELDRELTSSGVRLRAIAAGPVAEGIDGLARSLAAARETCQLAGTLALGRRLIFATDVGVHRLLRQVDDAALEQLVDEQLGPLLDDDALRGGELLRTLEVYVQAGANKTLAADRLGMRRQSLYARLQRIEAILGDAVDSHPRLLSLELALVAWRLRTAGQARRRPLPA